jgi:NAD(P)-dependent dehydrogenase (short-subunit alcohol dehydrogenase family)
MELRGKTAIVTGGSDGIGRATALVLARSGCNVAICARQAPALAAAAASIEALGRRALALPGDVADRDFVDRLVGETVDRFGTVDILVNNAGIGLRAPVQHLRREDLARVFDVNVYGALYAMQAVLPAMRAQGSGAVVNVASVVVDRSTFGLGGYAASKAALVALSHTLRVEVLRDRIKVIVVYPGFTRTGFGARSLRPAGGPPGRASRVSAVRRLRRRLRRLEVPPERVAAVIVEAIRRGRSEVWVTRRDRLALAVNRLAPGLFDRLLAMSS